MGQHRNALRRSKLCPTLVLPEDSKGALGTTYQALLESIGSPRALTCYLLAKHCEWDQLIRLTVEPRDYCIDRDFFKDLLATKFLSKYKGFSNPSLDEVALSGFKAAEEKCKQTNQSFRDYYAGRESALTVWNGVLIRAQQKILRMIGESPDLLYVSSLCRWGPGATATLKGEQVRLDKKVLEPRLSVTHAALPLARAVVQSDLHWLQARIPDVWGPLSLLEGEFSVIDANRVVTVPKDGKTNRVIAAEPTLNGYLQQGVGRFLRQRLKRFGIDLDDQGVNQALAKRARYDGLSTLDLSAASDSISRGLVASLLPPEWFDLLDNLRSPNSILPDGERIRNEKFSSMGNAYTFELESLIFYALCSAAQEDLPDQFTAVYGDDIVVPATSYDVVVACLEACGFAINSSKSYKDGLYFESCGRHYFDGSDVTPIYQKEVVSDTAQAIRLANRILRCSLRMGGGTRCSLFLRSTWRVAARYCRVFVEADINHIHGVLAREIKAHGRRICAARNARITQLRSTLRRIRVPVVPFLTEGDDGLMVPSDSLDVPFDRNHGYRCTVVQFIPKKDPADCAALLAVSLRSSFLLSRGSTPWWGRGWEATPYLGEVTIRGQGIYRYRYRMIHKTACFPGWLN